MGFIAHEFFDALPVHQFQYQGGIWSERVIRLSEKGEFVLGLSDGETPNVQKILRPQEIFTAAMQSQLQSGDQIEISPDSMRTIQDLAQLCAASKGFALLVDYG